MANLDCIARVSARATGTTTEAFHVFATVYQPSPHRGGAYTLRHLYAYLLHHGYLAGLRLLAPHVVNNCIGREAYEIRSADAIVLVESSRVLWKHALYWQAATSKLLDCTPQGDQEVSLEDFRISEWIPISKILT